MDNTKEFVVLRHLMLPNRGLCFFSTNCRWEGSISDHENNTQSYSGEEWYEEAGFADTIAEAQDLCRTEAKETASFQELFNYHRDEAENAEKKLWDNGYDPENILDK